MFTGPGQPGHCRLRRGIQRASVVRRDEVAVGPGTPFGGSTLPRLLENFPRDAKLLVVVSTNEPPRPKAYEIIKESIDGRGRIVAWQDIRDDPILGQALTSLLG